MKGCVCPSFGKAEVELMLFFGEGGKGKIDIIDRTWIGILVEKPPRQHAIEGRD